ncbi:hypothetical protein MUY27_18815 [Mucilaginibacter sp. RS28]|uniref:Uncharacterized protein n=1 Tax=Mucilaginibacter straminoryzae TaxID=2932774 RepID=A0A9X1X6F1_9SPHI|nr:hypothetical protein [Mucilaginibacter straminoryzae]MCJ8211778.1 hypothetical protein [Mucilaginibacter straminoryzae]
MLYLATVPGLGLNLNNNLNPTKPHKDQAQSRKTVIAHLPIKECCRKKRHKASETEPAATSLLSKIFMIDLPKLPFENTLPAQKENAAPDCPYKDSNRVKCVI